MTSFNENTLWMLMESLAARSHMEQGESKSPPLSELIKIASDLDPQELDILLCTAQNLKSKKNDIANKIKKSDVLKKSPHL